MAAETTKAQEERQETLEAIEKKCGNCKHWRYMGDKLYLGAWGYCSWEDQDILMLIPYWMFHKRNMYVSTNHFKGTNCGAWKDKHHVNRSGLDTTKES